MKGLVIARFVVTLLCIGGMFVCTGCFQDESQPDKQLANNSQSSKPVTHNDLSPPSYATAKPSQEELDRMVKFQIENSRTVEPKAVSKTEKTESKTKEEPKATPSQTLNGSNNGNTDGFKSYPKQFQEETEYIGNSKTKKFHIKTCDSVDKIAPANVVVFKSREEAVRNGYVPCKRCNP
jgi:hypothetical protein